MDTTEPAGKAAPVIEISAGGDVVLVAGPQAMRLKVHSLFLRSSSKVFGAMLGPNWSEGRGLSEGCLSEVLLVEDDAEALRIICYVIHHRNDDVPQTLTPEQVLQIAILADKYDLAVALRYARVQWLQPSSISDMVHMGYFMVSALLFRDKVAFASRTLDLVLNYTGSYMELLDDERISQFAPFKIIYLLEERRTRLRAELADLLGYWKNLECRTCGWNKMQSERYKSLQSDYGPLEMLKVPIAEFIGKTEAIPEEAERKYCSSESYRSHYHEVPKARTQFVES